MIEVNNLTKKYGSVTVLNIPQLSIPKGETFGLVGNNGAGKTTFFSLVLDIIKADSGEVLSNGTAVMQSEHWKRYTGSYLDENFLIDFLTPEEYFDFLGNLHGLTKEDVSSKLESYADFFNGEVLGKKKYIRQLSKGNQKKVGIIAALMFDPKVLILDEPFPNLDPSTVIRLKNLLKEMNNGREVTVLISSHDLNHITEICNRIVVLEEGDIVEDLKTSEDTLKRLENYFAVK